MIDSNLLTILSCVIVLHATRTINPFAALGESLGIRRLRFHACAPNTNYTVPSDQPAHPLKEHSSISITHARFTPESQTRNTDQSTHSTRVRPLQPGSMCCAVCRPTRTHLGRAQSNRHNVRGVGRDGAVDRSAVALGHLPQPVRARVGRGPRDGNHSAEHHANALQHA